MTNDDTAKIWNKVRKVRIGMLTLASEGGTLTSRPMTIQQVEAPDVLWFFTAKHGGLAEKIGVGASANITVADHGDSLYVSASGSVRLVDEPAKARELWNVLAKAWFRGGLDDPNLALMRLNIETAEYWDSDHSKMVQLLLMAKAAATGKPPLSIGSHHDVKVSSPS